MLKNNDLNGVVEFLLSNNSKNLYGQNIVLMMASHYKKIYPNLIKLKILNIKDLSENYINWLNDYKVTKHTDLIFQKAHPKIN